MWFVLFLVPALNYPANRPAAGAPETIYFRESLYIGLLAISGFSALGLVLIYGKLGSVAFNQSESSHCHSTNSRSNYSWSIFNFAA
jgi:putative cobalt transporter subunit CbtA